MIFSSHRRLPVLMVTVLVAMLGTAPAQARKTAKPKLCGKHWVALTGNTGDDYGIAW